MCASEQQEECWVVRAESCLDTLYCTYPSHVSYVIYGVTVSPDTTVSSRHHCWLACYVAKLL
jgi:hypothetical protein